eukprot:874993-Prymnesium_polylepis.1
MLRYSSRLGVAHWSSIWLRYMTEALRACAGAAAPVALVSHADLVREPALALGALREKLSALGVQAPAAAPAGAVVAKLLELGLELAAPSSPAW